MLYNYYSFLGVNSVFMLHLRAILGFVDGVGFQVFDPQFFDGTVLLDFQELHLACQAPPGYIGYRLL